MADSMAECIREAHATIDRAIALYQPVKVFAGFSGGNDSLVCADVTSRHRAFTGIFHANTGIGIAETRDFVRTVSRDRGWPLREIATTESYEDLVLAHGFPGPPLHMKMYQRLKDRPVLQLLREEKGDRRERIMIVTGLRQQESQRRMGYTDPINKYRAQVWVNACFTWSERDVLDYRARHNLPVNRVSACLGMSGECLCGAYAKPGEKARIARHFPAMGTYLDDLECRVRANGHDWGWEERPPRRTRALALADIAGAATPQPLCASCNDRALLALAPATA